MKKRYLLFLLSFLLVAACKKDTVDATTTMSFQESINDMTSSLPTLKQEKFNEALYILKTFAVEGNNDIEKLNKLGKLINGKKVPEILVMADEAAQKNGVAWSSSGPPSLGEMNIFGTDKATATDNNDIQASALDLLTKNIAVDSILGPKAVQIIPRLVDRSGNSINFSGAALETLLEVSSNGTKILTSKNLMQDNNFKGFTIRFTTLPREKINGNTIDVKVVVKTKKKNYQMIKMGIPVNEKALLMPKASTADSQTNDTDNPTANPTTTTDPDKAATATENNETSPKPNTDPKNTITKFLNNLGSQNLKAAYDASQNPSWGSYDNFANPTSGFGAVRGLNVKNISTANSSGNTATVNATYDVTDNSGKTTPLKVTFGLKNVDGEWKISSYRIN